MKLLQASFLRALLACGALILAGGATTLILM